jgi:DNA anti-recombination protein RmuC
VGTIGVKAAEIAAFRDQYSEGEKLVKDMYSMFSGSYSKGKTGEEILRHWMGEFIKVGWVKGDQSIGGGHVEYAICFEDDKIIAVDSKVANTKELAALSDQDLSHETRAELRKNVVGGIRKKLVDVEKYIDPDRTLPFAVMALPDPALDVVAELIPEAANKNILILGYSAVPQLVSYFRKIYGFYKATEKIEDVRQTLSKVQHEVDRLNANFFQHNFERPIGTLEKAFDTVKDVASGLRNVLGFHAEALKETGNP